MENLTTLGAVRQGLADLLDASAAVPDVIDGPRIVIQPAEPYVTFEGVSFGGADVVVNYEIYLFIETIDNATQADWIDATLPAVLSRLSAADWGIDTIGQPQPWVVGDFLCYGLRIAASRYDRLDTQGLTITTPGGTPALAP